MDKGENGDDSGLEASVLAVEVILNDEVVFGGVVEENVEENVVEENGEGLVVFEDNEVNDEVVFGGVVEENVEENVVEQNGEGLAQEGTVWPLYRDDKHRKFCPCLTEFGNFQKIAKCKTFHRNWQSMKEGQDYEFVVKP